MTTEIMMSCIAFHNLLWCEAWHSVKLVICCLFVSTFEFFFLSQDLDSSQLTPVMPMRSLTPTLLQSRKRFGTSSASSQSHTYLSSVESECSSSPRWEKDV